jgi:Holliday junction resolvase RusA-like endonuclease
MLHHEKGPGVGCSEALKDDLTSLIHCENATAIAACEAPRLIAGGPRGKVRARGGHVGNYTPAVTRSDESILRTAATDAMHSRLPFDQSIELISRVVFPVPASWPAKPRNQAIIGEKFGKKPDLDNIAKALSEAFDGAVFPDDALITRAVLEKTYEPQPLVLVLVRAAR